MIKFIKNLFKRRKQLNYLVSSSNFSKGCKDINDLHKQIQDKLKE
jgi:hypothetical protein